MLACSSATFLASNLLLFGVKCCSSSNRANKSRCLSNTGKQICGVWAQAIRRRDNELGKKQALGQARLGVGVRGAEKPTIDFLKSPTQPFSSSWPDHFFSWKLFNPLGCLTVSQSSILSVARRAFNKVSHFWVKTVSPSISLFCWAFSREQGPTPSGKRARAKKLNMCHQWKQYKSSFLRTQWIMSNKC